MNQAHGGAQRSTCGASGGRQVNLRTIYQGDEITQRKVEYGWDGTEMANLDCVRESKKGPGPRKTNIYAGVVANSAP